MPGVVPLGQNQVVERIVSMAKVMHGLHMVCMVCGLSILLTPCLLNIVLFRSTCHICVSVLHPFDLM